MAAFASVHTNTTTNFFFLNFPISCSVFVWNLLKISARLSFSVIIFVVFRTCLAPVSCRTSTVVIRLLAGWRMSERPSGAREEALCTHHQACSIRFTKVLGHCSCERSPTRVNVFFERGVTRSGHCEVILEVTLPCLLYLCTVLGGLPC
jgi:hypothetical protein